MKVWQWISLHSAKTLLVIIICVIWIINHKKYIFFDWFRDMNKNEHIQFKLDLFLLTYSLGFINFIAYGTLCHDCI